MIHCESGGWISCTGPQHKLIGGRHFQLTSYYKKKNCHYERRKLLMTYEKAMAEIVKFDDTDVITTSGVTCYGNVFSGGDEDIRCDHGW